MLFLLPTHLDTVGHYGDLVHDGIDSAIPSSPVRSPLSCARLYPPATKIQDRIVHDFGRFIERIVPADKSSVIGLLEKTICVFPDYAATADDLIEFNNVDVFPL